MSSEPQRERHGAAVEGAGTLVAVCTGHRCAGLRRLAGLENPDEQLRAAVRSSSGAVLLSCPCLGPCAQGPVTAVGHRAGSSCGQEPAGGSATPMVWLTESTDPGWRATLAAWIAGGVLAPQGRGDGGLGSGIRVPGPLRRTVFGQGAGGPLRRADARPRSADSLPW